LSQPRSLLKPSTRLVQRQAWLQRGHAARRLAVAPRAGSGDGAVPVRFTLQRKLKFGETHRLVGSHPSLGSWKVSLWVGLLRRV
jgi:hypothetical protein